MDDTFSLARAGLLTRAQVAAAMAVTEQTIANYEKQGLPVSRVGARRYYAWADVLQFIQKKKNIAA